MEEANENDQNVMILVEANYYTNDVNAAFNNQPQILTDEKGSEIVFDTYSDAKEWIDNEESETYYLSHGEAGRPSYTIVK